MSAERERPFRMGHMVNELLDQTGDALDGYDIMVEVFSIILNREEVTVDRIVAYINAGNEGANEGAEGLYEGFLSRAIDKIEQTILESTKADS